MYELKSYAKKNANSYAIFILHTFLPSVECAPSFYSTDVFEVVSNVIGDIGCPLLSEFISFYFLFFKKKNEMKVIVHMLCTLA